MTLVYRILSNDFQSFVGLGQPRSDSRFREGGGERCTVSGSCYEYDCRFGYCVEDVTPCEPDTLYGAAKDSLRRTFLTYCNVSGLPGSWGRAFFKYGPRENPARLVSSVIISLLKGLPAKSSHGLQVRDYMHTFRMSRTEWSHCSPRKAEVLTTSPPAPPRRSARSSWSWA